MISKHKGARYLLGRYGVPLEPFLAPARLSAIDCTNGMSTSVTRGSTASALSVRSILEFWPTRSLHPSLIPPSFYILLFGFQPGLERYFRSIYLLKTEIWHICPASTILSPRIDSPKLLLRGGWLPH